MKKIILGVLLAILTACGREIPEGFAPVTIRLGAAEPSHDFSKLLNTPFADVILNTYGGCPGDRINLLVGDTVDLRPQPPQFRELLATSIKADPNFSVLPVFEKSLLVPKGSQKYFLVSGQLSYYTGGCEFTHGHIPLGGLWIGEVTAPRDITIATAIALSSRYVISDIAPDSTLFDGTPFVALQVTNQSGTGATSFYLRNLSDETPRVSQSYPIGAASSAWIYPLVPFRSYRISLVNSDGIIFAAKDYVTRGPKERSQVIEIGSNVPAVD